MHKGMVTLSITFVGMNGKAGEGPNNTPGVCCLLYFLGMFYISLYMCNPYNSSSDN